MRNEPSTLEELLGRVNSTKRKEPIYICIFVDKQNYDELSKFAGKYGVLGHSFDREHIYLRAKSPRKAKKLLKTILAEKKPKQGVKGAYVTSLAPAPGLDPETESRLRYELRSRLDISEKWPICIMFYNALVDAGKVDEKIEELKEFAEVDYGGRPWDSVLARLRPRSKEDLEKLVDYRRNEAVSGILNMDWNAGKFRPCGENNLEG